MSERTPPDTDPAPPPPLGDELFCWKDFSRVCNESCVAFRRKFEPSETSCELIEINRTIARRLQRIAEKL